MFTNYMHTSDFSMLHAMTFSHLQSIAMAANVHPYESFTSQMKKRDQDKELHYAKPSVSVTLVLLAFAELHYLGVVLSCFKLHTSFRMVGCQTIVGGANPNIHSAKPMQCSGDS